jgi:hypothetical protein
MYLSLCLVDSSASLIRNRAGKAHSVAIAKRHRSDQVSQAMGKEKRSSTGCT